MAAVRLVDARDQPAERRLAQPFGRHGLQNANRLAAPTPQRLIAAAAFAGSKGVEKLW